MDKENDGENEIIEVGETSQRAINTIDESREQRIDIELTREDLTKPQKHSYTVFEKCMKFNFLLLNGYISYLYVCTQKNLNYNNFISFYKYSTFLRIIHFLNKVDDIKWLNYFV